MDNWFENTWSMDIRRERSRHERNARKQYLTDTGLYRNQHSGSYEPQNTSEERLLEAIAEYQRSEMWD